MSNDELPKLHPSVLAHYAGVAAKMALAVQELQVIIGAHHTADFLIDMGNRLKADADKELKAQNWGKSVLDSELLK